MAVLAFLAGRFRLCAASGALALAVAAAAPVTAGDARIDLRATDGLIYLDAREAPLGEVLRRVAEAAGFELRLNGPLERATTISLRYAPVAEGVAKLLGRTSWVGAYRRGADGAPRLERLVVLSHTGATPENAPVIDSGVGDIADRRERLRALQALVRRPDPAVVADLAELVLTGDDPSRSLATIALGELRAPEARDALVAAYEDPNPVIRRWAIRGLGRGWGADAVPELSDALTGDPDPAVRREALLRLARVGTEEAAAYLSLAENDASAGVRKVARNLIAFRRSAP